METGYTVVFAGREKYAKLLILLGGLLKLTDALILSLYAPIVKPSFITPDDLRDPLTGVFLGLGFISAPTLNVH